MMATRRHPSCTYYYEENNIIFQRSVVRDFQDTSGRYIQKGVEQQRNVARTILRLDINKTRFGYTDDDGTEDNNNSNN